MHRDALHVPLLPVGEESQQPAARHEVELDEEVMVSASPFLGSGGVLPNPLMGMAKV